MQDVWSCIKSESKTNQEGFMNNFDMLTDRNPLILTGIRNSNCAPHENHGLKLCTSDGVLHQCGPTHLSIS
ncbi:hypothetical protein PBY51_016586 [Eleginops maclovinus]|uniref:Uncharacterized protein n=1 Tax=Eleginops maclovinus TaxID=56733 RepID=A0AAN7WQ45_ELEMC|nr:hypothetical protein PBY51_016586 [Eleginops maclovinus]